MSRKPQLPSATATSYQTVSSDATTLPKAPTKLRANSIGSGFVAQLRPTSPVKDYSYIPMGAIAEGHYTEF